MNPSPTVDFELSGEDDVVFEKGSAEEGLLLLLKGDLRLCLEELEGGEVFVEEEEMRVGGAWVVEGLRRFGWEGGGGGRDSLCAKLLGFKEDAEGGKTIEPFENPSNLFASTNRVLFGVVVIAEIEEEEEEEAIGE